MTEKVFIDGNWINSRSQQTREIRNPATLELLGTVSDCDKEDVDLAVNSARRAQREWWKKPGVEKASLLREVAARISPRSFAMCMERLLAAIADGREQDLGEIRRICVPSCRAVD